MTLGTDLRKRTDDGAIAALIAVRAMWFLRRGTDEHPHAFALHSLKHREEAELLRSTYGSRFLLIGATAERRSRVGQVQRRLVQEDRLSHKDAEAEAVRLVNRDEAEQAEELGQQVREVFKACDAFVRAPADGGETVEVELVRLVRLLFGYPFATPRIDELAMFHAYAASLRSAALGRQVGCAVVDDDGEVVFTGMNDVARAGGGQYWSGVGADGRDFAYGQEPSDHYNLELVYEALVSLRNGGWLEDSIAAKDAEDLVGQAVSNGGPLSTARVLDLLEFGRVVHAEMAALMTAARRGVSVRGATLYTTTFPCHECARHVVAAGIRRVVYLDPYPKSRVADLYSDSIAIDGDCREGRIPFEPFVGVTPRLFQRVFEMGTDKPRKIKGTGTLAPWDGRSAWPLLDAADLAIDRLVPDREAEAAQRAVDHLAAVTRNTASAARRGRRRGGGP